MVHRVVKASLGESPVYMVALVDNLTRVKKVHRKLLKVVVGISSSSASPPLSPGKPVRPDDSIEDELFAVVWETSPRPAGQVVNIQPTPVVALPATVITPALALLSAASASSLPESSEPMALYTTLLGMAPLAEAVDLMLSIHFAHGAGSP